MVTSLSLPPLNYLFVNFITFSLFLIFLLKKSYVHKSKKLFFFYGWLFGFGYFSTNLYWISISLTFDQNFKFLIPIIFILIPTFLALFYGLVSYFFIILKPKKIVNSFLIFSLIFGIIEFIRGSILTGFPWNLIAYSFSNQLEILSIISIIGTYGLNLLCISLYASPAIFILKDSRKDIGVFIFLIVTFIFFYFYGSQYMEKFYNADKRIYDYKIRVVGSNISLDRFYSNVDSIAVIEDLLKISDPDKNEKIFFIWPEGIIPDISQEELIEYNWLFDKKFNKNHILGLGIHSQSTKDGFTKYYNSFSVYDHKLNLLDSYNKVKLVPFGEFLPLENILKNAGLRSITNNYQSFSNGNQRNIIKIKKENYSLKILPLICYEVIYPGIIYDKPDFDLIVNKKLMAFKDLFLTILFEYFEIYVSIA